MSKNEHVGLAAKGAMPIWQTGKWEWSGEYLFYVTHYGENQSGFRSSEK
ncbi:MAG: hypothetical protein HP494_14180 [Nitrospira sp.]|nr:hypothetical protein [Nitrospira sp.]